MLSIFDLNRATTNRVFADSPSNFPTFPSLDRTIFEFDYVHSVLFSDDLNHELAQRANYAESIAISNEIAGLNPNGFHDVLDFPPEDRDRILELSSRGYSSFRLELNLAIGRRDLVYKDVGYFIQGVVGDPVDYYQCIASIVAHEFKNRLADADPSEIADLKSAYLAHAFELQLEHLHRVVDDYEDPVSYSHHRTQATKWLADNQLTYSVPTLTQDMQATFAELIGEDPSYDYCRILGIMHSLPSIVFSALLVIHLQSRLEREYAEAEDYIKEVQRTIDLAEDSDDQVLRQIYDDVCDALANNLADEVRDLEVRIADERIPIYGRRCWDTYKFAKCPTLVTLFLDIQASKRTADMIDEAIYRLTTN